MLRKTDDLNRDLKRNVYINKVKDVASFIQFINNIYKSIIGKSGINEFFFKFDRALNVSIIKLKDLTFDFTISLKNIRTNVQMYLEDLYSLLYLFFVDIEVKGVDIKELSEVNHQVKIKVKINTVEDHSLLIKDVLLRIKEIKKSRSATTNG